jgi:hypothetical protein
MSDQFNVIWAICRSLFNTEKTSMHASITMHNLSESCVIVCSLSSLPIWHTPLGTTKTMHNAMISVCISLKQFLNDKGIDQAFRNTRWIPRALPLPRKMVGNIKLHHISSTKLVARINDTWTNEKTQSNCYRIWLLKHYKMQRCQPFATHACCNLQLLIFSKEIKWEQGRVYLIYKWKKLLFHFLHLLHPLGWLYREGSA